VLRVSGKDAFWFLVGFGSWGFVFGCAVVVILVIVVVVVPSCWYCLCCPSSSLALVLTCELSWLLSASAVPCLRSSCGGVCLA
jgi:hypothetical protein